MSAIANRLSCCQLSIHSAHRSSPPYIMVNSPFALQTFLRTVPVCESTATLDEIQSIFAAGQDDTIVALSEQGAPLGAIDMKSLMPHLVCRLQIATGKTAAISVAAEELASERVPPFDLRVLMRPIAVLPGEMSVQDFLAYLRSGQLGISHSYICALVDCQGKFQGLLDSWELLKRMLPTPEHLQAGEACFPYSIHLAALFQLLDKLPIPLMLQTAQGQVRHQNCQWRQQIGDRPDDLKVAIGENASEGNFASAWCSPIQEKEVLAKETNRSDAVLTVPSQEQGEVFLSAESPPKFPLSSPARPAQTRSAQGTAWQFIKFPLDLSGDWELGSQPEKLVNFPASVWLTLATDITEQRQLCKELAAKNADLVQLNRLKDEFLACISHELKTPLTAVLGLSSLLKDRKLGELTQRQARYAQLIYQSGRQLMTVVNDILDLTRLEAGQLKLSLKPVRLKAVCDRAYEQAIAYPLARQPKSNESPVQFTLNIEPGLTTVVADELRLRQMLVHLLDNALKFTPAGGQIGLRVSRWQDWVEFTVWDTGIGIPEASQHLIFQKFQQLESPLTRQHEGTGLGLVLTQRLARAHGGDISFISKVGQGSQFTLLLPPHKPISSATEPDEDDLEIASAAVDSSPSQSSYRPLVLIVESVPQYIEQLHEQLQTLCYRVAIARSGTEALEKARQLQPRVILLNPELPLLSGWDVLILLKADARTQKIPAIVMAASADKELSQQNGADGFLSLPVEKVTLQESLYRLGERLDPNHRGLTILRLSPERSFSNDEASILLTKFDPQINPRLANLNYRILSTDDLEQAALLGRVWKPDVLLLDSLGLEDPTGYLHALAQHEYLASLPLIALDAQTTAAANKVSNLSVFPCLIGTHPQGASALLQVIQIAAGLSNHPRILIVSDRAIAADFDPLMSLPDPDPVVQELIEHLHKAGVKSAIAQSWQEVNRHIQRRKIDAIILNLRDRSGGATEDDLSTETSLSAALQHLAQLPMKPPLLVLDRRPEESNPEFESLLKEIATRIFSSPAPAWETILEQLHSILAE